MSEDNYQTISAQVRIHRRLLTRIVVVMVGAIVAIEAIILVPATARFRDQLRRDFFDTTAKLAQLTTTSITRAMAAAQRDRKRIERHSHIDGCQSAVFDAGGHAVTGLPVTIGPTLRERIARFVRTRSTVAELGELDEVCYALYPLGGPPHPYLGAYAILKPGALIGEETRGYVIRILGLVLVICTGTSLIVLAFLHLWVVRPIRRIISANLATARGAGHERIIPDEFIPEDEFGIIMKTRNLMVANLRSAREKIDAQNQHLESWSRTLEQRVEERTAELAQAHERMVHSEKLAAIGKLAAAVAHEINNPLGVIAANSEDLRRQIDRLQSGPLADALRALEIIRSQIRRCKNIVDSLLRFSRRAPAPPESIPFERFLAETIALVKDRAARESKRLDLEVVGEPHARAIRMHLQQALVNLLDNALDATDPGDTIAVRAEGDASSVMVLVTDRGDGIPEHLMARIFEPFFTTKEPGKGTGMGLALARQFVQASGGRLQCSSRPGEGTTFRITLPANGA